jgi:chromosome segregation ATPase
MGPGIIETLQAQVKQREGELYQFRAERSTAQSQREKLAAEVVRLSALADQVEELKSINKQSRKSRNQLDQKHTALLTLYGEKVETVEELLLDLADVKQLLRNQTEEWVVMQTTLATPQSPP